MTMNNISIPLDIENIRVLNTTINNDNSIVIEVESTEKGVRCHQCGQFIDKLHGTDNAILLRHLPILDRPVYLKISPKRFRCPHCKKHPTTTQTCDWYKSNTPHTKVYEQFILRELINSTIVDVGLKQMIGEDAVLGIVDRHISSEVDWSALEDIRELGIDEISLKKGHKNFVTIISCRTHQQENKIIAVLPDRKKETVKNFLLSIPAKFKPRIKRVCSDMYDGFINAVHEALPEAEVVVDRFHVAKHYRECADNARKHELKRLKKELTDDEYTEIKQTMWPFRKFWEDLDADEQKRLRQLLSYSDELKHAYIFRELLTCIFEKEISKADALVYFDIWQELAEKSGFACFEPFLTTLNKWSDEISNYFLDRESSGFVEGLNNKIKVLKRRCYGILNIKHLKQRLSLDLDGYKLFGHHRKILVG